MNSTWHKKQVTEKLNPFTFTSLITWSSSINLFYMLMYSTCKRSHKRWYIFILPRLSPSTWFLNQKLTQEKKAGLSNSFIDHSFGSDNLIENFSSCFQSCEFCAFDSSFHLQPYLALRTNIWHNFPGYDLLILSSTMIHIFPPVPEPSIISSQHLTWFGFTSAITGYRAPPGYQSSH